jgi:hypothetical protein
MSMPLTAIKNALPTGLLILGTQKAVSSAQGVAVPMEVQMEGALVGGVSAVAVDSTLRGQNQIIRGVAVGALLSAGMYLWKGDDAYMLWFPTGAISYMLSDWATSQMKV